MSDRVIEYHAYIGELEALIDALETQLVSDIRAETEIERLEARIEALEAALRIFADDENWRYGRRFDPNGSLFDGTELARAALAPEQEK